MVGTGSLSFGWHQQAGPLRHDVFRSPALLSVMGHNVSIQPGMCYVGSSLLCASFVFTHICGTTHLFSDIMTFTLLHSKRANTEEDKPKQDGTTSDHPASPPTQKKSKVTLSCDRFDICIYKVTDQAGNCWRRFEGSGVPLWQVPMW
jgi:hypothetical protein